MQGTMSQSVSGLRSDAGGKAPVSPDFGPMQGTRSQSVSPDFGPMQGTGSQSVSGLRSDAGGKAPVSPDLGLMQWARPSMCFICYCMVCGRLGELTKLHAYGFQFWFQVLSFQKRSSERLQCTHRLFSLGCLYSDIFDSCFEINSL